MPLNLRRPILARVAVALVVMIAALSAYLWLVLHWSYATGDRAGYLQKLSRKGWVCKTWEGELAMVAVPGSTPEKFFFTVRDAAVIARLEPLMGGRVTLTYEQHRGLPGSCFGETDYYVVDVRPEVN